MTGILVFLLSLLTIVAVGWGACVYAAGQSSSPVQHNRPAYGAKLIRKTVIRQPIHANEDTEDNNPLVKMPQDYYYNDSSRADEDRAR